MTKGFPVQSGTETMNAPPILFLRQSPKLHESYEYPQWLRCSALLAVGVPIASIIVPVVCAALLLFFS